MQEDEDEDVSSYLKETRGYWKLKEEALARTLCEIQLGRGCAPVVRKTT